MKILPLLFLGTIYLSLTTGFAESEFGAIQDPYTGNWSGTYSEGTEAKPVFATIIEYKNGYEITFRSLPDPREDAIVIFSGKVDKNSLLLDPALSLERSEVIEVQKGGVLIKTLLWEGTAKGDQLSGKFAGKETGTFSLKRVPFKPSPTLGKTAPKGATVLFDGTNLNAWEVRRAPDDTIQWKRTDEGSLEVVSMRDGKKNKQDLTTKEKFGDYSLHLEFKLPHKPTATGQGRSNSGIFHMGIYETQILDSFGLYGHDNECGGIYKIREPDSNAGYPGGLWQTYDIEVQAPRFDAKGRKTESARMTVRLNGVLVHDDVEVSKPTGGGKEPITGPIILQDHGNPVQFRNIWIISIL